MRRLAVVLLIVGASLTAAAVAGGGAAAPRVSVGGGIGLRLPRGWHVVGRLQPGDYEPAMVASFAATFARQPCPCATPNIRECWGWCEVPNVRNFPRAGALLVVWEYPPPQDKAELRRIPHRPARFRVTQKDPHFAKALARELRRLDLKAGHACAGGLPGFSSSWWSDFRDAGQLFHLDVYLGPTAGRQTRDRIDSLLDSLQVSQRFS